MGNLSPLNDKLILVVDDETDILDTLEEVLDMSIVHKAVDHKTGQQLLTSNSYDIVILDIMGVNGFELLKSSVSKGFPTIMLSAHSVTPMDLKKSIELGAIFFMPKEHISQLPEFLEGIVLDSSKSVWMKLFDWLGDYYNRRFGVDWKVKDKFFKEFEQNVKSNG